MFSPQTPQEYVRSDSFNTCLVPQPEQSCVVYAGLTLTAVRPALSALKYTKFKNRPHDASEIDLLNFGKVPLTNIFLMFKSSIQMMPYLLITFLLSWWQKSVRLFVMRSCTLATTFFAFLRSGVPFVCLDSLRCAFANAFSSCLKKRGFWIVEPSDIVVKVVNPRSIPTSSLLTGSGCGSTSQDRKTNHLPVDVLETVQVLTLPSVGL